MHIDLVGRFQKPSMLYPHEDGPYFHWLIAVDEFSHFVYLTGLTKKSDVVKKLEAYLTWLELKDVKVKQVQADGEAVLNSRAMVTMLDAHGVKLVNAPPYTPKFNGLVERYVRSTSTAARANLAQTPLSTEFHYSAAVHCVNTMNNIHHAGELLTPHQMLFQENGTASEHLPFGCSVVVYNHRHGGKDKPRGIQAIYLHPARGTRYTMGFVVAHNDGSIRVHEAGKWDQTWFTTPDGLNTVNASGYRIDNSHMDSGNTTIVGYRAAERLDAFDTRHMFSRDGEGPLGGKVLEEDPLVQLYGGTYTADGTSWTEVEARIPLRCKQCFSQVNQNGHTVNVWYKGTITEISPNADGHGHVATIIFDDGDDAVVPLQQVTVYNTSKKGIDAAVAPDETHALVSDDTFFFDTSRVDDVIFALPPPPAALGVIPNRPQAKRHPSWKLLQAAEEKEYANLIEFHVYDWVAATPEIRRLAIPTKLTYKIKKNEITGVEKAKCRVVMRGDLEFGITKAAATSPVGSMAGAILLLKLSVELSFHVAIVDVISAFLQPDYEGEKYARPPPSMTPPEPGMYWRLRKLLYGSPEAGQLWYKEFSTFIYDYGFIAVDLSGGLFAFHENDTLIALLHIHVDDCLFAARFPAFLRAFLTALDEKYGITCTCLTNLEGHDTVLRTETFMGMTVDYVGGEYAFLSQQAYVDKMMEDFNMTPVAKPPRTPLPPGYSTSKVDCPEEQTSAHVVQQFQAAIGALHWLQNTRHGIRCAVSKLATIQRNPSKHHIRQLQNLFQFVYATKEQGIFPPARRLLSPPLPPSASSRLFPISLRPYSSP